MKTVESIENIAKAEYLSDRVIKLTFLRENCILGSEEVKKGWGIANKLDKSKNSPILLKTGKWTLLDEEARKSAFIEMEIAILVQNLGQRIMGNFALNLFGDPNKVKIFDKEEKALKWLS